MADLVRRFLRVYRNVNLQINFMAINPEGFNVDFADEPRISPRPTSEIAMEAVLLTLRQPGEHPSTWLGIFDF